MFVMFSVLISYIIFKFVEKNLMIYINKFKLLIIFLLFLIVILINNFSKSLMSRIIILQNH